jgi:tRNA A-37 threonylcarbamoyl transferase component Bud32
MNSSNLEGQTLNGRYQIQTLIGQGGMASVYKAYDLNLRRAVAIKIIHPHLSNNPEFFRRFEEEATAVAHLRHPNIVQMFDYNHDGDLYYMVMEFVMGETLQARLKRLNNAKRRLSLKEAINFTAEICDAAYYAHQRGLIHRDIKPANIMLDVNGRAILMDFGIARMVGTSQHTASGAVLGTALYMSPEQIQGLQIDARADIYSIGVTLYEMLSGKPPFEADSAMTLMMMHLNDPVPDLREFQPDTPPELVAIINKSLAKNRDERYQSASELATVLRQTQERSQKGAAGVAVAVIAAQPSPEATFIEAPVVKDTGETMIETPGQVVPVKQPAKPVTPVIKPPPVQPQSPPTLMEQAVQPVQRPVTSTADVYPESMPGERKKSKVWVSVLIILLILVLGGGGYFVYSKFFAGSPPESTLPSPTSDLGVVSPTTNTPEPTVGDVVIVPATATETPLPSPTPTEIPTATPAAPVIGGADKIGFFNGRNIWVANLDGTELTQLTQDGSEKNYLRWLPDGQGLSYISGKCIQSVSLSGVISQIACFNNSDKLEAFEVSPDGKQVVISLDSQLYLVPFDLELLANAYSHDSLSALGDCAMLAPYTRHSAHFVRWSKDNNSWAVVAIIPLEGIRADVVVVFDIDKCYPDTYASLKVQFPPPHFTYSGYKKNPTIQDLAWDGISLFAFHGIVRNGGFGDLHTFNLESFKFIENVNPIDNTCCYRDPQFSPDGLYLVFAFQDMRLGQASTTKIYYIPFGSIGTGATFDPLPLPEFADVKEQPQPALRPAIGP